MSEEEKIAEVVKLIVRKFHDCKNDINGSSAPCNVCTRVATGAISELVKELNKPDKRPIGGTKKAQSKIKRKIG